MLFLIGTALAACASTTLRGFQNKLVAAGTKLPAFGVGFIMNSMDVFVVAAIVKQADAWTLGMSALGAGTGWVLGMTLHDYLTRKKREAATKAAKKELKAAVDKRIAKAFARQNNQEKMQ